MNLERRKLLLIRELMSLSDEHTIEQFENILGKAAHMPHQESITEWCLPDDKPSKSEASGKPVAKKPSLVITLEDLLKRDK